MKKFYSTKTYDHNEGLSCAFRQWKATSHCNFCHGYNLSIKFVFSSNKLDERNWVVDFGDLKDVKEWLKYMFDHTTCVAADDPELDTFKLLQEKNLVDLRIVDRVGCEGFSDMIFNKVNEMILNKTNGRCKVFSVEVREHPGNSAFVQDE